MSLKQKSYPLLNGLRNNRMKVNLTKTWELLLRGRATGTLPEPIEIIGRKEKLKLLVVTFEQFPVN